MKFEKGLLEQFRHILKINFVVLFSSENFKRENGNLWKYRADFFYFLWYHNLFHACIIYAWMVSRWIVYRELAQLFCEEQ